jgi:Fur family peroxide stress response transcriptional regulator
MEIDRVERKHSRKRDAILRVIQSTTSHPGAQWVYDQLKPAIPDLSLGTVYRNINLFLQEGSVISVGVVDGEERFDGFTAPHPHFVCGHCGRVIDIPCPEPETLKLLAGGKGDFSIDYRKTTFYGVCGECGGKPRV